MTFIRPRELTSPGKWLVPNVERQVNTDNHNRVQVTWGKSHWSQLLVGILKCWFWWIAWGWVGLAWELKTPAGINLGLSPIFSWLLPLETSLPFPLPPPPYVLPIFTSEVMRFSPSFNSMCVEPWKLRPRNFLQSWGYSPSALSSRVATGPLWLLSTWTWLAHLWNGIVHFN